MGDTLAKTAPSPAVQQFSCSEKAGGRVEPLGRTPKKHHPVQIVRKMPLAYDNQRAPKNDTTLWFRSKTFVKTKSCPIQDEPEGVGMINRLKTLKRQMYGRTGTELLRTRLLPFVHDE